MACMGLEASRTSNSFGVGLLSGSLNRQASRNSSASFGYAPAGVSRGAGSLTICCSNSKIDMVMPPPWRDTPLDLRLSFLDAAASFFGRERGGGSPSRVLLGDSVSCRSAKSSKSESPPSSSAKGKRPSASSIKEMPRDQTSDLTEYCAP